MASALKLLQEAGLVRHNLIVFALLTAAFNGIVTASIGGWLAQTYADHNSRRQYVQNIADLIYERHTRARMVLSSIRRGADFEEVRYRKRTYDEVFVEWNKKIQNNVLPIRQAMGAADASELEFLMQTLLVPALGELDVCTTKVYDLRLSGQEHAVLLAQCQRQELSQFILECGSGITDELYRFTQLRFLPFGGPGAGAVAGARTRIRDACKRPAPGIMPATSQPSQPMMTDGPAPVTPAVPPPSAAPLAQTGQPLAPSPPAPAKVD